MAVTSAVVTSLEVSGPFDLAEVAAAARQVARVVPLVVIRACGHADVMPTGESHARDLVQELDGFDHPPTTAELEAVCEPWRPYQTWVAVMLRLLSGRAGSGAR